MSRKRNTVRRSLGQLATERLEPRCLMAVGPYIHTHNNNQLAVVDSSSGAIQVLGTMTGFADNDGQMADIAFSPQGRLYGITDDWLYEINPVTAKLTPIGQHTVTNANSLSFDSFGALNVMSHDSLNLYKVIFTDTSITQVLRRATISAGATATGANGDITFVGSDLVAATNDNHLMWFKFDVAPDRPRVVRDVDLSTIGVSKVYGVTNVDGTVYLTTDKSVVRINTPNATTTTATIVNVTLTSFGDLRGASYYGEAGGPVPVGTIAGSKWNDTNGDGIRRLAEAALADWQIYLDLNLNGVWDTTEPVRRTDARGRYYFFGMSPDMYTVDEILPATGWQRTAPLSPHRNLIADYDFTGPTARNELFHDFGLPDLRATGVNISGGSANLVNANSFLELGQALGGHDFTIAIDATYVNTIASTQYLISQRAAADSASKDFELIVNGSALTTSATYCNQEGTCQSPTQGALDGQRHQVALTWDGTNIGNFFDTSLITTALSGTRPDIDGTLVRFGNPFGATIASGLRGLVHEIRIYDRALTQSELQAAFSTAKVATGYSLVLGSEVGADGLDFGNRTGGVVEHFPEIEVHAGTLSGPNLTDGAATVDLGQRLTTETLQTEIWIRNTGDATLTLPTIVAPTGFSLSGTPATSLPAGQSTSFTISLSSTSVGTYTGDVSITNNDSNENPFTFTVTAKVLPPPDPRPRTTIVNTTSGSILQIDPTTGVAQTLISTGPVLTDIAYDPISNRLMGINASMLYEINLAAKTITPLYLHGLTGPTALAFSPAGELFAASQNVYRLDLVQHTSTQYAAGPGGTAGDIEFVGTRLLMATDAGDLYEIRPISNILVGNMGVAVKGLASTDANTLIGYTANRSYYINPTTAAATARPSTYLFTLSGSTYLPLSSAHNDTEPLDVDNSGFIVPLDALLIINELNNRTFTDVDGRIVGSPPASTPYPDVNNDGYVTPLDALMVINRLNGAAAVPAGAVPASSLAAVAAALPNRKTAAAEIA